MGDKWMQKLKQLKHVDAVTTILAKTALQNCIKLRDKTR